MSRSFSLQHLLEISGTLVGDGAMGTMLLSSNLPPKGCPEMYTLSHPDTLAEIHRSYYDAGSDWVETNTFGATRPRLAGHNLADRVHEINVAAATIARSVCPDGKWVAGSVGPCGLMLQPLGESTAEEVYAVFREQALALAEGGVDFFIVETMMAVDEAELAVRACVESTGLPTIATMTFEKSPAGFFTMWGTSVREAADRLEAAGAVGVGANCGCGFSDMVGIVREMRPVTTKPILAQSNAGIPISSGGSASFSEGSDEIGEHIDKMIALGANMIGGCCGTTPDHIRVIRQHVSAYNKPR